MYMQRLEEHRDQQATIKEMERQREVDLAQMAAMTDKIKHVTTVEARLTQYQTQVTCRRFSALSSSQ